MPDELETTTPPESAPPPAPTPADEPDWARKLRESIEGLPAKLRATVSDDDKREIGQHVYDFFDRGGAFKREEEPGKVPEQKVEKEKEETTTGDKTPQKGGGLSKFAAWFAGE